MEIMVCSCEESHLLTALIWLQTFMVAKDRESSSDSAVMAMGHHCIKIQNITDHLCIEGYIFSIPSSFEEIVKETYTV